MMDHYKVDCSHVYNVDKTGITTELRPDKIIARKCVKQLGSLASEQRGMLDNIESAINTNGIMIPPVHVFLRKNYPKNFVSNGPPEAMVWLTNRIV